MTIDNRTVLPARQLLSRRWVYRTLREVYLEDGREIVKRFVHHKGRRDWRRVWQREDCALRRLEGLPVPKTHGYCKNRSAEGPEYILRKQYIAGTPLTTLTTQEAQDMGTLLARIHERGVVTGDPSHENFLRAIDGELYFIDFGRARTWRMRTPLFYLYAGKDLARLYRTGLPGRADLWPVFLQAYRATFSLAHPWDWLLSASLHYWRHRWRQRSHGGI
jgi:tRNA A-37 threonylcarbamoyl transferase component Bud32